MLDLREFSKIKTVKIITSNYIYIYIYILSTITTVYGETSDYTDVSWSIQLNTVWKCTDSSQRIAFFLQCDKGVITYGGFNDQIQLKIIITNLIS